jgi:NADPH-dependent 2,4-dienoyl-CoA reductase/sulfur reductase-like enzyme
MPEAFEIIVAGAGPAGIAAACAAAESGARVAVLDDNPSAGGQIWRGASPEGARWFQRFHRSGASLIAGAGIVDHPAPGALLALRNGLEPLELRYQKLILATGARERFLPFPGWTLPNVMGVGGLQALVKGGLPIAGKRVVVAGSGPLLLAVADYLHRRGAIVPLIAEQTSPAALRRFALSLSPSKLAQAAALRWRLRGTRYTTGCWPISAEGVDRLEAVTLHHDGRTWREPCHYLAVGFGLVPNTELAALIGCALDDDGFVSVNQQQQTSVESVYCAGEPTGIGGLDLALASGAIAGYAAAGNATHARRLYPTRGRALRFKDALARAFSLREELTRLSTPDTIVCRCEDVPLSRLALHASWRSAKLHTRCGMGPCQGRICGPALAFLYSWLPDSIRPPIFPTPVSAFVKDPTTH